MNDRLVGASVDEYHSSSEGAGITFNDDEDRLNWAGFGWQATARSGAYARRERRAGQASQIYFDVGVVAFEYHTDPEKTAQPRDKHDWVTVGEGQA